MGDVHPSDACIHLLPFSHLDLYWLGDRHQCLSRAERVILQALWLCEENSRFRFLIEDAVFAAHFAASRPRDAGRLRRLMREGRIEGPATWAAITQTNVQGETLVRNIKCGLRWAEDFCGVRPRVLHLGDLPAQPSQLPQIAARCGLSGIVMSRGGPYETPLFDWRTEDGSSVRTWTAPNCYNWGIPFDEAPDVFRDEHFGRLEREAEAVVAAVSGPILMHYGWDLSIPVANVFANVDYWNEHSRIPIRFSTQAEYFHAVSGLDNVPVFRGALPTVWGNWPDSAYLDVTRTFGRAETDVLCAERLDAVSRLFGAGCSGQAISGGMWTYLLEAMEHNYSNVAAPEAHETKRRLAETAQLLGRQKTEVCLSRIAARVRTVEPGLPILVFNPSSHVRTDIVEEHVILYGFPRADTPTSWRNVVLEDSDGKRVPHLERESRIGGTRELKIAFPAAEVPSMGVATYFLRPDPEVETAGDALVSFRAADPAHGAVRTAHLVLGWEGGEISLGDAEDGSRIVGLELRLVEQDPENEIMQFRQTGGKSSFVPGRIEIGARHPVCQVVRMRGRLRELPVVLEFHLFENPSRLDVAVTVKHPGEGYYRVQLVGRVTHRIAGRQVIGVPYGADAFDTVLPGTGPVLPDEVHPEDWPRVREALDWFLLPEPNREQALWIGTERKVTEWFADAFAVNILSSMTAKWTEAPERWHPFAGTYTARFSFARIENDTSLAARLGAAFSMPLRSQCLYGGGGTCDGLTSLSPVDIRPDTVQLTALKGADDGNGTVLRLVETAGKPACACVRLHGAPHSVFDCNLLEEKVREVDPGNLRFAPREIKTLLFL